MGIIFGLTAAIFWGTSDFIARYATRMIGTYRMLLYMQLFGVLGLSAYLLWSGELVRLVTHGGLGIVAWAILAGALNMLSSLALFRSFEIGILSVVSPIASSYAAITIALAFLSGEVVSQLHLLGLLVVLVGVVLAATSFPSVERARKIAQVDREKRGLRLPGGVGMALLAALGYGITFWVLGEHVVPVLGGVTPVWVIRVVTVCLLPLMALPLRQTVTLPRGRVWWYLAMIGILDTAAFVADTVGLGFGQIAVVSVLASLFSVVTVILAWIFMRDKLQWSQWLGIGIIFIGIILVNI